MISPRSRFTSEYSPVGLSRISTGVFTGASCCEIVPGIPFKISPEDSSGIHQGAVYEILRGVF